MPHPIPLAYRLMFNYIEPFFALGGVVQSSLQPQEYLRLAMPSISYTSAIAPLFPQFSGSWAMLAFHDVVTLRVFPDRKVWKLVLGAALLSDVGYTAGMIQSMGTELFFNPLRWNGENAMCILSTAIPLLFKVAFLLGIGVPRQQATDEAAAKVK